MSDYLKTLFIDEAKAVLLKGGISGGSGDDGCDHEIATDEEVDNVVDDIYGDTSVDDSNDAVVDENNIATDEEVGEVITGVFG